MSEISFHPYRRDFNTVVRRVNKSDLSEANKQALHRFSEDCTSEGLSIGRVSKYLDCLMNLARLLGKDFVAATTEDIRKVAAQVETSKYSAWYKHDLKVSLKKFYKWLRRTEDYPEEVRWLKTTVRNLSRKLPEDLVTEEEAKRMIACTDNARDRALISVLFDSGCRIGEIGTLKVKHVQFDKYGAAIIVNGKTGMRRVRLVPSVPSLAQWLAFHSRRDDPEAPLWLSLKGSGRYEHMSYEAAREVIINAKERAGIKKRIHPYLFRHASGTFWADKLTEAQMCERFGWVQGSKQAATYVHLSGREVDESVLKVYGLKKDTGSEQPKMKPRHCPRCKTDNEPSAKFCVSCGMALDPLAANEADKELQLWNARMSKLVQDPDVQRVLIRKLQEMDELPTA